MDMECYIIEEVGTTIIPNHISTLRFLWDHSLRWGGFEPPFEIWIDSSTNYTIKTIRAGNIPLDLFLNGKNMKSSQKIIKN